MYKNIFLLALTFTFLPSISADSHSKKALEQESKVGVFGYWKKEDCKKIISYSKKVLNKAVKKGGSSIRDFKNISGQSGNFQKEFNVYQRENLNCMRSKCSGKVEKIFITNRSTFYCNTCQK